MATSTSALFWSSCLRFNPIYYVSGPKLTTSVDPRLTLELYRRPWTTAKQPRGPWRWRTVNLAIKWPGWSYLLFSDVQDLHFSFLLSNNLSTMCLSVPQGLPVATSHLTYKMFISEQLLIWFSLSPLLPPYLLILPPSIHPPSVFWLLTTLLHPPYSTVSPCLPHGWWIVPALPPHTELERTTK